MKRLLLAGWLSLGMAHLAFGQAAPTFLWNGVLTFDQVPPQVDATNFINEGQFDAFTEDATLLYETSDTLNYTNAYGATMSGAPGLLFDNYSTFSGAEGLAASFNNSGFISGTSGLEILATNVNLNVNAVGFATGLGDLRGQLKVLATNIVNTGAMQVDADGLLRLQGGDISLPQSTLTVVGASATGALISDGNAGGIFDEIWGIGPNTNLVGNFDLPEPSSPLEPVGPFLPYANFSIDAPNASAFVYVLPNPAPSNTLTEVVFLSNPNPGFTATVRFEPVGQSVVPSVQWQSVVTNIAGAVITNSLYLADKFETIGTNQVLATNNYPVGRVSAYTNLIQSEVTYIPKNYTVSRSPLEAFTDGVAANTAYAASLLANPSPTNAYSIYVADIEAGSAQISSYLANNDLTNIPGRIELSSSGNMDLSRAQITGANYLLIEATNQFVGNAGALIEVPTADLYLTATNGSLVVSNLLTPTVPRINGELDAWSSLWTNVNATTGFTNVFHVLIADGNFSPTTVPSLGNVTLRSTNQNSSVVLSDPVDVNGNFLIEAQALTLTLNGPGGYSPSGELNLLTPQIIWSGITPQLEYLTNFGVITTLNESFFGLSAAPPFFNTTFTAPYQAFVNDGAVSCAGEFIWGNYFENTLGTISAGSGSLTVQSLTNLSAFGEFDSASDMLIESGTLVINHQTLNAGGALTLAVTNALNPTITDTNLNNLTNTLAGSDYTNTWLANNGFNLLAKPVTGDLLGTTVTSFCSTNRTVVSTWAGVDEGNNPSGYTNDVAVGHLILDGDQGCIFNLNAASAGSNGMYVDLIEVKDYATNRQPPNFTAFNIAPNMTVYFADAQLGGQDISEKLNGANGGRFQWVSNYNTGLFSSTNQTYPDGKTFSFNRALVISTDISTRGNGIPNSAQLLPIPEPTNAVVMLSLVLANQPQPTALVSWQSPAGATNYLYFSSSLMSPNWVLVTNFVQGPQAGPVTVAHPANAGEPGYFRVRFNP